MSQLSPGELAMLPKTGPYNWAEAFTLFCGGLPLEDIANMMLIPFDKLEARHRSESWPKLAKRVEAQMMSLVPVHPDDIAKRGLLVQANREKNLELWNEARDITAKLLRDIASTDGGKGMFKKVFHNKGQVVVHEGDMTSGDWATICNALQTIAQGTYAAMGDRISASGAKDGEPSATNSGQPVIQIILPEYIAKPRSERGVDSAKTVKGTDAPVIDA